MNLDDCYTMLDGMLLSVDHPGPSSGCTTQCLIDPNDLCALTEDFENSHSTLGKGSAHEVAFGLFADWGSQLSVRITINELEIVSCLRLIKRPAVAWFVRRLESQTL